MSEADAAGVRVIRWGEAKAMPWKNGGGVTHEIAVFPAGATFETFEWRLSMAEVSTDGPFSAFDGIDRTLALMHGAGLDLLFDNGGRERIDGARTLCRFDGGAACTGQLIDGAILDLNVMTRRGKLAHDLIAVSVADTALPIPAVTAVICHTGGLAIAAGAGEVLLGPRDVLLMDTATGIRCKGHGGREAKAYVLHLRRVT